MITGRTNSTLRNISTGFISQIIQMILGFVSRTVFINYLSAEYLGVSSLFSNILSMMALAEMGIASAFIYELYKPLSSKNEEQTAVVLRYFRKTYAVVGVVVFITGLLLMPFLNDIIAEKPASITEDIRVIFLFYIVSTASSYFFSYKMSLLDADQKISVSTINNIKFLIGQNIVQIVILIFAQNFLLYVGVQILSQFLSNLYISRKVNQQYPFLSEHKHVKISPEVKNNVIKNVKAAFLTKIGGVLVNATDNVFISMFVGLALLGKYSNYVMLFGLISGFLMIIFANIKSSVAHFVINESLDRQRQLFKTLNFLNFVCFGVASLLIYFCINDFIEIWIGTAYVLTANIPLVLAINFFMLGMQNGFWTFKGAYGYFQFGKYMVLGTAAINLVLSYILGKEYGIVGIITATLIARLFTNFWYDPFIVLTKGLHQNPWKYLSRFLLYLFILCSVAGLIYGVFRVVHFALWLQLLLKFFLTLTFSFLLIFLFMKNTEEMKSSLTFVNNLPLIKRLFKAE